MATTTTMATTTMAGLCRPFRRHMSITRPKQWFERQANDPFVKRRISSNFRSRSAFKLEEMQAKYAIMRPGHVVLDLGAAPGGWTQVALNAVRNSSSTNNNSNGRVISVDIMEMEPIQGADIVHGDVQDPHILQQILQLATAGSSRPASNAPSPSPPQLDHAPCIDVLISDMAHPFSGHKTADTARVEALCEFALQVADHPWLLKHHGNFVCKYIRGAGGDELKRLCETRFQRVIVDKPKASRKESAEAYLVCLGFKRRSAPAPPRDTL
ncbi:FtsJ-like methyltransferase-domain-containing protein [Entophlyctis helioformis]|nr:FtsJ-like methyltransferase-domain-containing protein [Entophlyctis helioformis]